MRVIEQARAEPAPAKPQGARLYAIAAAIGVMIGCVGAFIREHIDQRVISVPDMEAATRLPVIGIVPHMTEKDPLDRQLIVFHSPRSAVAEAFRAVRAAILFAVLRQDIRSVLVTSPSAGDGKTTCVTNLGVAMAMASRRTLLIDADLRNPSLDALIPVTPARTLSKGLVGVLGGKLKVEEAIRSTDLPNLDVLPVGPGPSNPGEMIESEIMTNLLADLASRYDMLIVNAPPVLAVADAQVLSSRCDATIMVLRQGQTSRLQARRACSAVTAMGANVLGMIANDVRIRRDFGGYGYYSNSESPHVSGFPGTSLSRNGADGTGGGDRGGRPALIGSRGSHV